jgi:pyruvate formate lyase activating enzyme
MAGVATAPAAVSVRGTVFNIQRCSVHDGPGIRTTVFLKGCSLSCAWCHNPESRDPRPELALDLDRCIGCEACREACPNAVDGQLPGLDRSRCERCGACVEACPSSARTMIGNHWGVDELASEVEKDRPFFDRSGGGVTFSGGEPLAQADFLLGCLEACRARGMHTAVDTTGFTEPATVVAVSELTDLFLYDLKLVDPVRHRRHTGVDNAGILTNLRLLSSRGARIWVRLPLIPDVNDDDDNIDATARVVESLPGTHAVHVLPYHDTAAGKLGRLGAVGGNSPLSTPAPQRVAAVADRLRVRGIEVVIGGTP